MVREKKTARIWMSENMQSVRGKALHALQRSSIQKIKVGKKKGSKFWISAEKALKKSSVLMAQSFLKTDSLLIFKQLSDAYSGYSVN